MLGQRASVAYMRICLGLSSLGKEVFVDTGTLLNAERVQDMQRTVPNTPSHEAEGARHGGDGKSPLKVSPAGIILVTVTTQ